MLGNDDELEFESQESPQTEYIIEHIEKNKKSIIYGLYTQLTTLENFYSRIQINYKKVAISWLVAAFAAMGYLFSQEFKLPLHPIWILIFISVATMFGITLLWFIDISIYQTYFYTVVVEESKLETQNKWLPKINSDLGYLEGTGNTKTRSTQSYFYIGCHVILMLIICLMSIVLLKFDLLKSVIATSGIAIFCSVIFYLMIRFEHPNKKKVPIRESLKSTLRLKKNKKH